MGVEPLLRTLDQEVLALYRGATLECLVCGEFVQHRRRSIACPECGSEIVGADEATLQLRLQAG
jgi:Zn finger protein HypA/HybF involved in hydrogenase expression